jgi:hypothetical protein
MSAAATEPVLRTSAAREVGEFVTIASIDALNAKLAERGIDAGRIIAVLPLAPQVAATPAPERFRVLYRLNG